MNTVLVLTVIGEDRPGLVESLAAVIAARGGSWLESRMAHLAGKFAGILRIEISDTESAAVTAELQALGAQGLRIVVERGDQTAATAAPRLLRLDLIGDDHPGIVRDISRALAARGINVEELHTEIVSAAMSGEPLFKATARLAVPGDLAAEQLRDELERLALDLVVDLSLADDVTRGSSH